MALEHPEGQGTFYSMCGAGLGHLRVEGDVKDLGSPISILASLPCRWCTGREGEGRKPL